MPNKAKRDPRAPKRNLSAYLLYQNAMRDQFKANNPGMTFGQLSKYTSAMYSEMPPAEKEAWIGRAEADKARYLAELAEYVPSPGYDEKGDMIVPAPFDNLGLMQMQNSSISRGMGTGIGMGIGIGMAGSGAITGNNSANRNVNDIINNDAGVTANGSRCESARSNSSSKAIANRSSSSSSTSNRKTKGIKSDIVTGRKLSVGSRSSSTGSAGGGKAERDANAPKRKMSAYLLYQNAMRNQFRKDNPGMTFGQLAKYTSHMYKNLTPEEKSIWVERAEQDKMRYDNEMSLYTPPPGHDAKGNLIIEETRPKRRNRRAPKDPDAPKRASGAYVFFTNEVRPEVMEQFPGIKFVEMGRILGERWRALTKEDKVKFEEMAQEDKKRFQAEMMEYEARQALVQQQQLDYAHVQMQAQAQEQAHMHAQMQARAQARAHAQAHAANAGVNINGQQQQQTMNMNMNNINNMNMVGMGMHPTPIGTVSMGQPHQQVQTQRSFDGQQSQRQGQAQISANAEAQQQQEQQFHRFATPNNIISSSSFFPEPLQQQQQQQQPYRWEPESPFDPATYEQQLP